jgi:hypothetical protein
MTRLVPICELAHLRLALPTEERWIDDLAWIPVSATELHLACRYYPVAARLDGAVPRLGLIVDQRYLTHALLGPDGTWRGAYRPIGLRCFPFHAPRLGDNPLADLRIDADSPALSATAGLALVDPKGEPSRLVSEVHRRFRLLQDAEASFAGALDQCLMAGLLVPLASPDGAAADAGPPLHVLDPARFSHVGNRALAAMARHAFLSVDVAVAWLFSLQTLRPGYRPKPAGRHSQPPHAAATTAPDMFAIDELALALDDGELIPLGEIAALGVEGRGLTA